MSSKDATKRPYRKDLTGLMVGRWTVLREVEPRVNAHGWRRRYWLCRCECGTEKEVDGGSLRGKYTLSCGCLRDEITRKKFAIHGEGSTKRRTFEYSVWAGIVKRCCNQRAPNYRIYGGRGITICDRWRNSFVAFLEDMGRSPSRKHSIDRIDNNGHYEPGNCRWATRREQGLNKRANRLLAWRGETKPMAEWARLMGLTTQLVWMRLSMGWSVAEALGTPVGKRRESRRADA